MTHRLSRDRRDQVDKVVAGILDDMVSGRWVAGRSHREIAAMHAVSVDRVKDWAAEAGRTLRVLALVDREDLRARNQARLDALYALAVGKDDPDVRAAVSAIAEQGKLLGLNAPEKHQVAVADARMPQDASTELEQCLAARDALDARIDELRAALAMPVVVVEGGD